MRTLLVVSAALGVVLVGYPYRTTQAAEDVAEVAARRRQDAVKTIMIEYKRTEVLARGSKSEDEDGPLKPKTTVPDKEMTIESTNRLVIDGVKVRIEDNHPRWLMPAGKLLETKQVGLFDGAIAKSFFSEGLRDDGSPMGYILRDHELEQVKFIALIPITLTIRAFQPAIDPLPMGDMKPTGMTLPIGGVACQEYAMDYGTSTHTTCWLDASKDYAVRRIRMQFRGRLSAQTDVTSYRHEDWGWIPTAWVCNQYSSAGAVLRADKMQVLELRVNGAQPAEQFELQFPSGTVVGDGRNGKFYRVEPDGSMRQTFPVEKGPSGSVPQPGAPWYQRHKWLIVGLAVVLAVAGLLYTVRRKRRPPL
jgi:hypothetical protein